MPKGAYTQKQERKADRIATSYRDKGVSKDEAAKKGWETRRRRGNG
jgi:hypothetical protein